VSPLTGYRARMDVPPTTLDEGPLPAWRARVAAGHLGHDAAQAAAAERLQVLWRRLRGYDPALAPDEHGLLSRLWRRKRVDDAHQGPPQGLYLVGEVGRGKSMLMDLFFATADVPRKRRQHFHDFMQQAHARFHALRADPAVSDPIPRLADAIAAEAALLCFDEFQVTDIVDAMILGRLFAALFERGVVVVATSNTRPSDLFAGQPGRDAFLPFIRLLESHLDLLVLDGGRDFRRLTLAGSPTWFVPADARADAALDAAFLKLTGGAEAGPDRLNVQGRSLKIPLAAAGVARFDFAALCEAPLGPGDYLALATHYNALVLDGVPRLSTARFDAARRFVTLIDVLYDHRVKLVASADAGPDGLYPAGEGAAAFQRTASRLVEMQGDPWWRQPHVP